MRALILIYLFLFLYTSCLLAQISIPNTNPVTENFDAIGASATASLPSNWKFSRTATSSPAWNDTSNFTATNFAASSGAPTSGGRYNWGKTGGTDRSPGFITSQNYKSSNSIMAWCSNQGSEKLITLSVSYDLFQFRINTAATSVTFFYSTDGTTWTACPDGDAQPIPSGPSGYNFTTPPNFGRSTAANTDAFTITGLNVPPNGNIYLRWNFYTWGSSLSEGLGLDNVVLNGGFGVAALTRGPYMNLATQTGIIIRWRTDAPANSKVSFGTIAGSFTDSITDGALTTEHIVQLTGLADNTRYYYSIGYTGHNLQGDGNNYFKTLPVTGSKEKVRILAMGDMGDNSTSQKNVRDAYLKYNGTNLTNIWILLGDNAYVNGLDSEFQTNWFNIYQGSLTKNHVLWPAPGNHDYANSSARQADHLIAYYDMFSLPKNAEAGGTASNTEAYYSYNYSNIHFISLDSYGWETGNTRLYDTTGPQATWLKQDLAANTQKWTIVYFHHPPYTKVSKDSDTDPEEIKVRQSLVRILERYKVDLVLSGHSHGYERSYLINGHYGLSGTFDPSLYALSTSSARYDGTANSSPDIKNSTDARNGIVYSIVGSSGSVGVKVATYPHPAMYYSNVTNGGSMVLEIEDNRLDAKWICSDGVIRDNFTMMKEVNKTTDTTISSGSGITLTSSWIGNYVWSNGATTRSVNLSPTVNTAYTVIDNFGSLKDSFNIKVNGQTISLSANATSGTILCNGGTTDITAAASGGTTPYSYSIDGTIYQSGNVFTGKTAGSYTAYVKDAVLSIASTNITITQPTVLSATSIANPAFILCNGGTSTLTLSAMGGTSPYTGTGNFTVTAGTYNYTVTDVNGCSATTSITISQPAAALTATATAGTISCYGGTTTVTVSATGGAVPYSGTGSFTVTAGTYNYTITDANGCAAATSIIVTQPAAAINISVSANRIACYGGTTNITINPTGGTGAYSYSLNGGTYQTSNTFTNLKAGNYTINVKDANNCTSSQTFTITQPASALNISLVQKTNVSCRGGSDGSIIVSSSGGTSPYLYSLNNGTFTTSSTFSNLKAGNYSVTAKDANGCTASLNVKVADGKTKCITSTTQSSPGNRYNPPVENKELTVQVFPNPTENKFALIIESSSNENVEIVVTDIYGRKVFQARGSVIQKYTLGGSFVSGMYILRVIQGTDLRTLKLIKAK